ncbi:MAG: hypothetical protein IJ094_03110 [Bacilli bacterium]|nr:hypothetical protein [Bacilli bacterium]
MIEIDNNEIFDFFENLVGDKTYFGLHLIYDKEQKNEIPEYSALSKEGQALSILDFGLINQYGNTIKHTVSMYGNLSYHPDSKRKKDINEYNKYTSKENISITIVVAIPIFFETSDGIKMFGGWDVKNSFFYDEHTYNRSPECITDMIFSDKIPPEMILGYYITRPKEEKSEFYSNEKYYYNLPQLDRDKFVNKYFKREKLIYNVNGNINFSRWILSMKEQYDEYVSKEYQDALAKRIELREEKKHIIYYTNEELENLELSEIDISRVKPNYYLIINSKYNIKELLLITEVNYGGLNTTLAFSAGFNERYDSNLKKYLDDYESFCNRYGSLEHNYKQWYLLHKSIFDDLFIQCLSEKIKLNRNK